MVSDTTFSNRQDKKDSTGSEMIQRIENAELQPFISGDARRALLLIDFAYKLDGSALLLAYPEMETLVRFDEFISAVQVSGIPMEMTLVRRLLLHNREYLDHLSLAISLSHADNHTLHTYLSQCLHAIRQLGTSWIRRISLNGSDEGAHTIYRVDDRGFLAAVTCVGSIESGDKVIAILNQIFPQSRFRVESSIPKGDWVVSTIADDGDEQVIGMYNDLLTAQELACNASHDALSCVVRGANRNVQLEYVFTRGRCIA